jgi:hypothetical protein
MDINNTNNDSPTNKNDKNNNFSDYSLHNVENYNSTLNYTTYEILSKYNLLMIEFLKFMSDNINLKNNTCNKFIIIRGLDTVSHVFNNILYYSKNIELAFYHGQKAFYFYVEFIGQISDDQHTFLQLSSRDATMFVYKKTIFDINNEWRKNMNLNFETSIGLNDQIDIIHIHANITKSIISFFINKSEFLSNEKKSYLTNIIIKTANIIEKINDCKLDIKIFNIILSFIEQIDNNLHYEKYFEIINLFLKKINKGKINIIKIHENIYHTDFSKRIEEDTPEKFITWLIT